MIYYLDGRCMHDKTSLHDHLTAVFQFSKSYGRNLDALWDELSSFPRPLTIVFLHADLGKSKLGSAGPAFFHLLHDLSSLDGIRIQVDDPELLEFDPPDMDC